jgi:hypothetical protein
MRAYRRVLGFALLASTWRLGSNSSQRAQLICNASDVTHNGCDPRNDDHNLTDH